MDKERHPTSRRALVVSERGRGRTPRRRSGRERRHVFAASRRVVESWRGRIYSGVRDVRLGRGCADATTSERADPALASSAPTRVQRHGRGGVDDPAGERGGARARVVARKVHQTPRAVLLPHPGASDRRRGGRPILPPPSGQDVGHPSLRVREPHRRGLRLARREPHRIGGAHRGLRVGALDRPSPASRSLLDRPHSAVSLRAELPSRPPDPPPTRLPFSPFSSTPARETTG